MIIDHYDNLSFDEKEYYNKIYYGILKGKDSIRLLGLFDAKVLDKIIMVLKYEHAEIFYVDFQRMEYVITPEELFIIFIIQCRWKCETGKNMLWKIGLQIAWGG